MPEYVVTLHIEQRVRADSEQEAIDKAEMDTLTEGHIVSADVEEVGERTIADMRAEVAASLATPEEDT